MDTTPSNEPTPRDLAAVVSDLTEQRTAADSQTIPLNVHRAVELLTEGLSLVHVADAGALAERIAKLEALLTEAGLNPTPAPAPAAQ